MLLLHRQEANFERLYVPVMRTLNNQGDGTLFGCGDFSVRVSFTSPLPSVLSYYSRLKQAEKKLT